MMGTYVTVSDVGYEHTTLFDFVDPSRTTHGRLRIVRLQDHNVAVARIGTINHQSQISVVAVTILLHVWSSSSSLLVSFIWPPFPLTDSFILVSQL